MGGDMSSSSKRCRADAAAAPLKMDLSLFAGQSADHGRSRAECELAVRLVFHRLPDARFLLRSAAPVCRLWADVLAADSFWLDYCCEQDVAMPPRADRPRCRLDYRLLAVRRPYGSDLLAHTHGHRTEQWEIDNPSERDGMKREAPPIYAEQTFASCFVTSHRWASKRTVVDLRKRGVHESVLDELRPAIACSEWYAARRDCGSVYRLTLELLDADRRRLGEPVDIERTTEQWGDMSWHRVSHTFADYASGVRYVRLTSAGKDTQFWAGHYGAKMANASVVVTF